MKTIDKYILSKPWNVGKIGRTFPKGTVFQMKDNDTLVVDGKDLAIMEEFRIAMRIQDPKTGQSLVLPYSEKSSAVREILSSVKSRMEEKKVEAQKYAIVESDSDLVEEIDVSHIKPKPKAKIPSKEKVNNLEVIPEAKIQIPTKGTAKEIEQRLKDLEKPLKLKVVKDDTDPVGSVSTSSKVRVKPLSSVKVTKK